MESSEFYSYLSQYPKALKLLAGICSIDTIPSKIKINHFIIVNSDLSQNSGIHWFCLYRASKCQIECFDSLGVCSQSKKQTLISACNVSQIESIKVNTTPIQMNSTNTCGKFCLMFILERLHNPDLSFDELLDTIFTNNPSDNEKILHEYFADVFSDGPLQMKD